MTVCDLFKNLQFLRGKTVAVRGIYWYGLRESCPSPFVTHGHTWPSALNLVDSDYAATGDEPVPFKTNQVGWDKLDALIMREAAAGHREEIWVTVVGQIQAPETYVRKGGQVVGGYGHLGVFPAQLVVERVFEIEIKPTPTYDYSKIRRKPR